MSQIKARLLSETGTYPIKKPTGQRLQLLLNRFRVLIHEKMKLSQKLRCKIQKGKQCQIFDNFEVLVAILFFYKTAFISANDPIAQRNVWWLKIFNVPIHEMSRSLIKVA